MAKTYSKTPEALARLTPEQRRVTQDAGTERKHAAVQTRDRARRSA